MWDDKSLGTSTDLPHFIPVVGSKVMFSFFSQHFLAGAGFLAGVAITLSHVPESTHSAFRPSGEGEGCDKADGSLRLPCVQEVSALCRNQLCKGKKAALRAAL